MKKIKEKTIEVPQGISVEIENSRVKMKNENGEIDRNFNTHAVEMKMRERKIMLNARKNSKKDSAVLNAIEKHIKNMIVGLSRGFEYKLSIVYSHFPISIAVKQEMIEINNFLGEKKPRKAKIVGKAKVEVKGKEVNVSGIDLAEVSQTAANIESATKVKGKDVRIYQDGIYITSKGEAA